MPWSRLLRYVVALGVVVMVGASLWAPPQPELLTTGACQIAPCGMLEDPARWRAAWWIWSAGLIAVVGPLPFLVRPAAGLRPAGVLLVLLMVPVWPIAVGIIAAIVALFTSVHGAATVAACGILVPALVLVVAFTKGRRHQRRSSRDQRSPERAHTVVTWP